MLWDWQKISGAQWGEKLPFKYGYPDAAFLVDYSNYVIKNRLTLIWIPKVFVFHNRLRWPLPLLNCPQNMTDECQKIILN
jgi:hypothetical protein